MNKTTRNAPCPCGSGKKYKACCGTGDKTRSGVAGSRVLLVLVAVVVLAGLAIAVNHFRTTDLTGPGDYVYDAENDRYFDPVHGHWHDGRPPADADAAGGSGPAPEPWQYDAVQNRHYDPGHGHWHEGPPPVGAGLDAGTATGAPTQSVPSPGVPAPLPDDTASGGTPGAWDYDAENDRHWNPNTQRWEQGMPPLEAFTGSE